MQDTSSNACSRLVSANALADFQTSNATTQLFLGGSTRPWMTTPQTPRVPIARRHTPQHSQDGSQRTGGIPSVHGAQAFTNVPVTHTPPAQPVRSQAAHLPHPGIQSPTAARSATSIVQQNGTMRLTEFGPSMVEIQPTERQTTSVATVAAPIPPSVPLSDAAMPPSNVTSMPGVSGERRRKRSKISDLLNDQVPHSSKRMTPISGSTRISPQLPTPVGSPAEESDVDLLSTQLETALGMVRYRPSTVDQRPDFDQFRIDMLREACRLNDTFFLVVHLILCAWSHRRDALLSQLGLTPIHEQGLLTLQQQYLGLQRQLSVELGRVLSTFPCPVEQLLAASSRLVSLVEPVKQFLLCVAQKLPYTIEYFINRQCPPWPIELKVTLGLSSIVLQRQFFQTFLKWLGTDQDWDRKALQLFECAREDPSQNSLPAGELYPAQVRTPADHFCEQYKQLWLQHFGQHHTQPLDPSAQPWPEDIRGPAPAYPYPAQQPSPAAPVPRGNPINQQTPTNWSHYASRSNTPAVYYSAPSVRFPPIVPPESSMTSRAPVVTMSVPHLSMLQASPQLAVNNHTGQMPSGSLSQPIANSRMMQTSPPVPQSMPSAIVQRQVENDLLIPRNAPQTLPTLAIPEPHRHALHQVHLCSPVLENLNAKTQANSKWYHYVENVIRLRPLLDAESPMCQWKLEIPECYWATKAQSQKFMKDSFVNRRKITNGSTQFRLKCIASDDRQALESIPLSDLVVQPGRWPRHLSVSINGDMGVDFCRKVHHGADLPTDVTDLLIDGVNEVIACVSFTQSEAPTAYMMAIEVTRVADEEKVRSMTGHISAEEVSASIIAVLNGNNDISADEELVISQPHISIDLVDPFTSTMWNTPVRGKMCQHRECFDLDAFLDSRTDHDGVTSPDQWNCPICRSDARPQMLVLDRFLANVRTRLEGLNKLDAKAILVNRDGTWEVKREPPGKSDRCTKYTTAKRKPRANTPKPVKEVSTVPHAETSAVAPPSDTVIVLDDD